MLKNWTTNLRHRPYIEWPTNYLCELKKTVKQSQWRTNYHIQPLSGLLNDPNGFSYFNGKWHLFYQSYPFGPVHGLKSWFHLESSDLIHWQMLGPAILPNTRFDSQGVYSGSAIPIQNRLFIMYTGNTRNSNCQRHAYQNGAWLDQKNQVTKLSKPLIANVPDGYTNEFRDPQIIKTKVGYSAIIGGQTEKKQGRILVFNSSDLNQWHFQGTLNFSNHSLGYMIECPNLVFIENQPVLIFCPQGLKKSVLNYKNIYPNTYVIGNRINTVNASIEGPSSLENLDDGFELYATQAFNAPDGRILEISWVGLPEISYPTDQDGWANCLSLVKELKLKDNHLYQYPVDETKRLRTQVQCRFVNVLQKQTILYERTTNSYELEIKLPADVRGQLNLQMNPLTKKSLKINYDTFNGKILIDRSNSGVLFAEKFGTTRQSKAVPNHDITLNIFVDNSVVEIYLNKGYKVITLRNFPDVNATQIRISSQDNFLVKSRLWNFKKTNED